MKRQPATVKYFKESTKTLIKSLHEINDFMRTESFHNSTKEVKDYLYDKQRLLLDLVQQAGHMAQFNNINLELEFDAPKKEDQGQKIGRPIETYKPKHREDNPFPEAPSHPRDQGQRTGDGPFKIGRPIGTYKPKYREDNPFEFPNITVGDKVKDCECDEPFFLTWLEALFEDED